MARPFVAEDEVEVAARERRERDLGLGFDQLAAELGRVAHQRLDRRERELQGDRLEARDACAAADGAGRRGQVRLGQRRALEQRGGVFDQHQRRVGQPHAAACALEQRNPGFALEHRELLGDRRGRVLERVGDGGDRAAPVQLAQQAQAAEVEHRVGTLPNFE